MRRATSKRFPRKGYRFICPIDATNSRPTEDPIQQQKPHKPKEAVWSAPHNPWLIASALIALIAVIIAGWFVQRSVKRDWARTQAIPRARTLAQQGDYGGAYALALTAARYIPNDRALANLWPDVSRNLIVHSNPSGADVAWKPYAALESAWRAVGATPVSDKLPFGAIRLRVTKAGYVPVEVLGAGSAYNFKLDRQGSVPPDMMRVARAGYFHANFRGIGPLGPIHIPEFWIDKYEVSNKQFKQFVARGGYQNRDYWKIPFVKNGRTLSWEHAMAELVDTTGQLGPATWEAGTYPDGQGDYPVSGVSWYEAAAYAEFAHKSLPIVYHWFHAAGTDYSAVLFPFSNFAGNGPRPVGSSGGLNTAGAFDMAGNVREWCWNSTGSGERYLLGGSWAEPNYMFERGQPVPPADRSRLNGFRCMKYVDRGPQPASLGEPIKPGVVLDYTTAKPVSDEAFAVYERLYAPDRKPFMPVVEAIDNSSELWRRETIRFDAGYDNEQVIAYLFVPKAVRAPSVRGVCSKCHRLRAGTG